MLADGRLNDQEKGRGGMEATVVEVMRGGRDNFPFMPCKLREKDKIRLETPTIG
jgi:hypothetical protein